MLSPEASTPFSAAALRVGVLVKNQYSGINFIDTYHRSGLYKRELPFIGGQEGGGVVAAVTPEAEAQGVKVRPPPPPPSSPFTAVTPDIPGVAVVAPVTLSTPSTRHPVKARHYDKPSSCSSPP
jgi:hypothetical protein